MPILLSERAESAAGDWTQAKYYQTIQLADVTKDGVAELVGRGRNGVQTYGWVVR